MGRIKSMMIRRAAAEMFATTEGFSGDFDRNKKILKDTMPSKKVRNMVAGQLARLAKQKHQKKHEQHVSRPEEDSNTTVEQQ